MSPRRWPTLSALESLHALSSNGKLPCVASCYIVFIHLDFLQFGVQTSSPFNPLCSELRRAPTFHSRSLSGTSSHPWPSPKVLMKMHLLVRGMMLLALVNLLPRLQWSHGFKDWVSLWFTFAEASLVGPHRANNDDCSFALDASDSGLDRSIQLSACKICQSSVLHTTINEKVSHWHRLVMMRRHTDGSRR